MFLSKQLAFTVSTLVFASQGEAQTYTWSPPNTAVSSGGAESTIPFWSRSATYQQIHDAVTLPASLPIKGMGMRPAGNRKVLGRSWNLKLTMSQTTVDAIHATATFATNLGSTNTRVVAGSATGYQNFSWPDFTTAGTQPAFTIPFSSYWIYVKGSGNLCFEWRFKDSSLSTPMPMDASNAWSQVGITLPASGTGCIATGGQHPATATVHPVLTRLPANQRHLDLALVNATSGSAAILALALSPATVSVGWCAPLMPPLVLASGTTDSRGGWALQVPLGVLAGSPVSKIYCQFGFADPGQVSGIGISNIAGYQTPPIPGANGISSIYQSTANNPSNGDELATAGNWIRGYGLSIAWQN